jgi:hypothetical protein
MAQGYDNWMPDAALLWNSTLEADRAPGENHTLAIRL